ncbi:MAG: sigma-54-dependent transcriptional regulator [Planctomycetota bacterium]
MSIERVLVVDDDAPTRELLFEILIRHGCEVLLAADGEQAVKHLEREELDLVLTDIRMPGLSGMDVLTRAREVDRDTPVILMTAYGTIESAVEAMKAGAFDYVVKPVNPDRVDLLLQRVTDWYQLVRENRYLRSQLAGQDAADELVGRHPKIAACIETVQKVAQSRATVLIQGESGTGKELIARLAHYASPRGENAFIKVNCAALSETLLESELFGHERGAFTGAISRREGRFELAHGGTLLLDEISEIPPALQAKLLRAIEEEEFERVGGTRTIKVDVRLVCTTNRDLAKAVAEGRFRDDLHYRLNVVPVVLPPLRERREDIPLLVDYFLKRFARECASPARRVSKEALRLLKRAPWPGNVRELRNAIHRAVVLATGETIGPADLPVDLTSPRPRRPGSGVIVGQSIDEMERELILKTLESTGWNKTEAARILEVTPRTLRNKLGRYREDGLLDDGEATGSRSQAMATA